jgi:transcriptional regulator with XRE-family HTH domain
MNATNPRVAVAATFGERLRALRRSRLMTLNELAWRARIPRGELHKLESDLAVATESVLQRLAECLDCDADALRAMDSAPRTWWAWGEPPKTGT